MEAGDCNINLTRGLLNQLNYIQNIFSDHDDSQIMSNNTNQRK